MGSFEGNAARGEGEIAPEVAVGLGTTLALTFFSKIKITQSISLKLSLIGVA